GLRAVRIDLRDSVEDDLCHASPSFCPTRRPYPSRGVTCDEGRGPVGAALRRSHRARRSLLLAGREDAGAAGLSGDGSVVAAQAVARARVAAARVRGVRVVLIVAVDDRGEPGRRAGGDAEVVEQVAVAGAGDARFADAAEVV